MDPEHDVTVALPRRWATRADLDHGIVVAARAPTVPPSGFGPEIVLRSVPVEADLDAWRDDAMRELAAQLDAFEVEDSDAYELGGRPASYRRFAHRVGTVDVICEQWAWVVDGVGVTLTGSVARDDYAAYCDVFEDVAATISVAAPGSAPRASARW